MRAIVLALALLGAGCSCATPTPTDAGLDAPRPDARPDTPFSDPPGLDTPPDVAADDGGAGCTSLRLSVQTIQALRVLDPIAPNASRSFRVQADYTQNDGCHARAMPEVAIDPGARTVDIRVRDWVSEGVGCVEIARADTRTITLGPLAAGTWTIRDASTSGTATLTLDVGPALGTPCAPGGGDCLQDCDCGFGERCLSGVGLGGPFLACALPCEEDFDCAAIEGSGAGPGGVCQSVDDGLELTCRPGTACDATRPCPAGYACTDARCVASFRLSMDSRHDCTCDAECEPGLRCVRGRDGTRCEVACATRSEARCSAMHWCAEAEQDVSGLAADDAVCGWVGE